MANWRGRPVYVLGAGFTKAFLPTAPLLVDLYPLDDLLSRFSPQNSPLTNGVLQQARMSDGRVDLERLMTRLQGGMPYDDAQGETGELGLLLRDVKRLFQRVLEDARKAESPDAKVLHAFARHCLEREANIITFNYDDLLDEALFTEGSPTSLDDTREWHPNGSYGFFCRPAYELVGDIGASPERGPSTLLKLHGSLNWRIKRGSTSPHVMDAFVHYETWVPPEDPSLAHSVFLDRHVELEPFIVPPTLNKTDMMREPLINSLWESAFEALRHSQSVTFVGYSMPFTDVAATSLFREAIPPNKRVKVVSSSADPDEKERELKERKLKESYRAVLGSIPDHLFDFHGAVQWAAAPPP